MLVEFWETRSNSPSNFLIFLDCTLLLPCAATLVCGLAANQNQQPMVIDAHSTPSRKDGQNEKPVRSATANGTKNGKQSGTRINVSLASEVSVVISWSLFHVIINARMLTSGSVNNNAPSRGIRLDNSATATITATEISALTINTIFLFPNGRMSIRGRELLL